MAMNIMAAPIPSITVKFECFSLFEAPSDVAVGEWYGGASTGDVATRGAVNRKAMSIF